MIRDLELARRLYGPTIGTRTANLPSMGKSLHDACNSLAAEPTLASIDELVSRLKTAEQTVTRLRLAVVESHGTGINKDQLNLITGAKL